MNEINTNTLTGIPEVTFIYRYLISNICSTFLSAEENLLIHNVPPCFNAQAPAVGINENCTLTSQHQMCLGDARKGEEKAEIKERRTNSNF